MLVFSCNPNHGQLHFVFAEYMSNDIETYQIESWILCQGEREQML